MDNTSLIKVSPGLLSALSGGGFGIEVFKKEVVALECLVAGTSFRKLTDVERELTSTVRLELKREPKNEFDRWAVALWFNRSKVGYIPRDKNEVIARLMDAGKRFYATIAAREFEGNWLKLQIQVILRD
ncbi:MAG: hypothetical protein EOO15_00725 [Chitinophagaceae bacterium]|nr:MAG: hypothetical protein EOO15_00725 [Chitinophagaceae bacterium]